MDTYDAVLTSLLRTFLTVSRKFSVEFPKLVENVFLPREVLFPLDTENAVLKPLLKNFDGKPIFSAQCLEKNRKSFKFLPLILSWKCSYGHVESNCDNPDRKILRKGRESFPQCAKKTNNDSFFTTVKVSSICSRAHVESSLDKRAG